MCFTGPRLTAPRTAGSCARATRRRHLRRRRSGCLYLRHGKPPPPSLSPDAQAPSLSPNTPPRRLLGVARPAAWPVAQPAPSRYRSYLLPPLPTGAWTRTRREGGGKGGGRRSRLTLLPARPHLTAHAACACMALSACACVALRACVRAWVTSYHLPLSPNLYPFTRAGRSAAVSVFVSAAKSSVAHIPCALSLLHTRSSQLFASQQNLKSAWLAQVPSVPPPSPGDVVVRLRRHLQSQCRNNIYAPYSRRLQDEQFTEVDSLTGSRQRRCCSFLLDPMICEAILGKNSRMYPPCPDAKEWDAKGVSIDAASLVKATKGVLCAGTVVVSKDSVHRGKHGNLCFSHGVHDKMVQDLDPSLVVKIKDFVNEGERLEALVADCVTQLSGGLVSRPPRYPLQPPFPPSNVSS